jgi:hypothetical protein
MAFNNDITPGRPPLLWSDVNDAFAKVNENFDILVATVGDGSGLTPLNFETLDTSVSPTTSNTYRLGSGAQQWKSVHTAEWSQISGSELNGLWAGSAQIKGVDLTVNLPEGSTVGGDPATGIGVSLIIDPDKTFFKTAQVDNEESVVANEFADTLNLNSGTAMQLVVDSAGESITFNNTGVTQLTGTSGQIGVSGSTGNITLTNLGVLSLTSTTSLPSGRTAGSGINIDNSTGSGIKITNTGVLGVQGGFGISVSTDTATGVSQVSFNPTTAPSAAFTTFHIDGDLSANDIVADSISDTFNIAAGYGIILANNSLTDTLSITLNQSIDIKGSVFGDDSTKIVDAVENKVYAEFFGNLTGNVTGNADTATTASKATAVTLVATNSTAATHYVTFVDTATGDETVRTDTDLTYNPNTNTLTAGTFSGALTGNIFTNLIDSADSSAITVTPATIFNSDVTVENDLNVTQRLQVQGSKVINLSELQAVVAASTSFSDFQARIAALV